MRRKIRRYFWNVLVSLDQLGNTLLLGNPDETISSRLGRLKQRCGGHIPWTWKLALPKLLDAMLEAIDPNHSIDAIEWDEAGKPFGAAPYRR